jgi:hypothetical protein
MSDEAPDIVARLREWSAADWDTHAVISRNNRPVGDMGWVRDAMDLHDTVLDAAVEIERLRAALAKGGAP